MPALYALAYAEAPAREVRGRRRCPQRRERRRVSRADEAGGHRSRARSVRAGDVGRARGRDALHDARLLRRRRRGQPRRAADGARQGARDAGEPDVLLRGPAERDRDAGRRDRQAPRCRRLGAADHREAVRPRPRLRTRAERRDQGALHGGRGLPDRPLPRQGDGPEHAGPPLRERHLRADLEPPVHRPRADHRRGVDRHRRRGPGTTRPRARSGTSSRTTSSSSSRSRRWSRRSTSPRTRCATRR